MKSFFLIPSAAIVLTLTLALAAPAAAGTTTVPVSMPFTEPLIPGFVKGCPVAPEGFCGSGEVIPFGHATETIGLDLQRRDVQQSRLSRWLPTQPR